MLALLAKPVMPASPTVGRWAELIFDGAYLLTLSLLVVALHNRLRRIQHKPRWCAEPLVLAFTVLALGDSAHVGSRLWGHISGSLFNPFIGYGAMATAVTVTLFDLLLVQGHQRLSQRSSMQLARCLVALGLLRLALLLLPQHHWAFSEPPQFWSLLRNGTLIVLTLGVGWLYLQSAGPEQRWLRPIGVLLMVSALLHLPVVLWVHQEPLLGLLMIPKSLAYLAAGLITYRKLPSIAPMSSR